MAHQAAPSMLGFVPISRGKGALGVLLLCLSLLGGVVEAGTSSRPRVVSLNLCTDQLVLLLADPEQIVALSHLSDDPNMSVLSGAAARYEKTRGAAEEVYLLAPDLVVAGTYTTTYSLGLLERFGLQVERFEIDKSLDDVALGLRKMGVLLQQEARAEALIARFEARLNALPAPLGPDPLAALYGANGYTSGAQGLSHALLQRAGFENAAEAAGLAHGGVFSLELLAVTAPDLLLTAAAYGGHSRAEALLDHPLLARIPERFEMHAAWVCATPALADVLEELSHARALLIAQGGAEDE